MEDLTEEEKRERMLHITVKLPSIVYFVEIEGTLVYDEEDTNGTCVDTERD